MLSRTCFLKGSHLRLRGMGSRTIATTHITRRVSPSRHRSSTASASTWVLLYTSCAAAWVLLPTAHVKDLT